jgi:hypothetical protein
MTVERIQGMRNKMNPYKAWAWGVVLITLAIYSSISVFVDPFGVFGDILFDTPKISMLTNQRFHKIKYLEKNFYKYNSYLIGGSRIAAIRPEWIEKYIPDSKFYNLFVSGATGYDNLRHVKYIIENYKAKHIVMQISLDDMVRYTGPDGRTLETELHYRVSGKNIISFYLPYLNPGYAMLSKKLKYALGIEPTDNLKILVEESGERHYRHEEKLIAQDHKKYIENEPTFHRAEKQARGTKLKEMIEDLREIQRLCDLHHVSLLLLITPHHHQMMNSFDTEDCLAFMQELSEISPFWDFSGYNSVTTDDRNYYESSHYRITVVKYILARVFNDAAVNVPEDFGVSVTKDNIEEHLKQLFENITDYRKKMNLLPE